MTLSARLTRLEDAAWERELEREVRRLAAKHGLDVDVVMAEARRIAKEEVAGLAGEETLRAWAQEEGLDVDVVLEMARESGAP